MGSRVVTTGAFVGLSKQVREANAARNMETKLAAATLVRENGLDPNTAMAIASGTELDDIDF